MMKYCTFRTNWRVWIPPIIYRRYHRFKLQGAEEEKAKQRPSVVRLAAWLPVMIPTQRSAEIKGTDEKQKKRRKGLVSPYRWHVKDVYPARPYLLPPELEMNKSSAQFTFSYDPDNTNGLCVIMANFVLIWDFSPAFIGTALEIKLDQSIFKIDSCLEPAPESKYKSSRCVNKYLHWSGSFSIQTWHKKDHKNTWNWRTALSEWEIIYIFNHPVKYFGSAFS